MNECKHKVGGQSDWVGACPYCEIERLRAENDRMRRVLDEIRDVDIRLAERAIDAAREGK